MLTERIDYEYGTEIVIWNEGTDRYRGYVVMCKDFDHDKAKDYTRVSPTANIHMQGLSTQNAQSLRQLATEYAFVADVAEQLQAEKRAAYAERYSVAV